MTKMRLKTWLLGVGMVALAARAGDVRTVEYRGIYADDPCGREGLYNPERGFRLEVALDVAARNYVWDPEGYPDVTSYLDSQAAKYRSDSVSLVQTYFYLTGLVGRDLGDEDFRTMQTFFDRLRALGKKAVLRFAYETEFMGRAPVGPTYGDVANHVRQLAPFLAANRDVIAVVQAGMIGAWGEWHSSVHGLERTDSVKRAVLEAVCRMTPAGRYVQVRVPAYKNLLGAASRDYGRVSFHDDFIIIKPHVWDGGLSVGTPAYRQMEAESPWLPMDGELPWGTWSANRDPDNPEAGWLIDGWATAQRLCRLHFTSLSAIHNYKEGKPDDKFSMQYWKETPVLPDSLRARRMPLSDGYFRNADGTPARRNVFEYIRDHLGYRIELQRLSLPRKWRRGACHRVELALVNRGFSTLFNDHEVCFVLLDEAGRVCAVQPTSADVRTWQPYAPDDTLRTPLEHKVTADFVLPGGLPRGTYRLGLWLPDGADRLKFNPRFAIRCANGDVPWWTSADGRYGVNLLTEIRL